MDGCLHLLHRVALKLQNIAPLILMLCHCYAEIGLRRKPSTELQDLFKRHSETYSAAQYYDERATTWNRVGLEQPQRRPTNEPVLRRMQDCHR